MGSTYLRYKHIHMCQCTYMYKHIHMCECMCAFRFIFIRVNFLYEYFQVDQRLCILETKYIYGYTSRAAISEPSLNSG